MKSALWLLVWCLLATSIGWAETDYPVSAQTFSWIAGVASEMFKYERDLADMMQTASKAEFQVVSVLADRVSLVNEMLQAVELMIIMEQFHGEAKQFNQKAIDIIKDEVTHANDRIAGYIQANNDMLPTLTDGFLIQQIQRNTIHLLKVNELLSHLMNELPRRDDEEYAKLSFKCS